jgi:hypothetical protein
MHRAQVMDVLHDDFHRDPLGILKRIYAFLGLRLAPQVETAMMDRIADAPELKFGQHRYDVADFGLTEDEIRERFGAYIDHFGLRPERPVRLKAVKP